MNTWTSVLPHSYNVFGGNSSKAWQAFVELFLPRACWSWIWLDQCCRDWKCAVCCYTELAIIPLNERFNWRRWPNSCIVSWPRPLHNEVSDEEIPIPGDKAVYCIKLLPAEEILRIESFRKLVLARFAPERNKSTINTQRCVGDMKPLKKLIGLCSHFFNGGKFDEIMREWCQSFGSSFNGWRCCWLFYTN